MSTSLAVRHRPTNWASVAGQQHLVAVLRAASKRRPVPPQILLAGPSGVGKTTLARVFAAALFCPAAVDGEACGVCEVCVAVTGPGGRHPDVIELDAASHGGIQQIRDLAGEAHLAPLLADYRVYIIDEAHGLTKDGAQAFLRLLEEPPAHTIFILATTDPQKLPDALRGRCLLCYATAPTREEKIANLRRIATSEGWAVSDEVLGVVVDGTDPVLGVRGTVTNLDKVAGALEPGGGVDAATAATLLGVADPRQMAALTAAVGAGDKAAALTTLVAVLGRAPRTLVHTQLVGWAHRRLRECLAGDGEVEQPVWFLTQLAAVGPEHLEVAVAKMAHPHLGGVEGLAALVERAEAVAAGLTADRPAGPAPLPPAVADAPVPRPVVPAAAATPVTPAPATAPQPVQAPAPQPAPDPAPVAVPAAAPEAPVPEVAAVPVDMGDPDFLAWVNAVAKSDPLSALALRRCQVSRAGLAWTVGTGGSLRDPGTFAASLTQALPAGHTLTVT